MVDGRWGRAHDYEEARRGRWSAPPGVPRRLPEGPVHVAASPLRERTRGVGGVRGGRGSACVP